VCVNLTLANPSANSNKLAAAVAVGAFGVQSQEALAATVAPLIEVPGLLGLVYVALVAEWEGGVGSRRPLVSQYLRFRF